jgi:hypothetical protein
MTGVMRPVSLLSSSAKSAHSKRFGLAIVRLNQYNKAKPDRRIAAASASFAGFIFESIGDRGRRWP